MKLRQIINAVPALTKLANADMGLQNSYNLQKLLSSLQTEIEFFNEHKMKIASKYGTVKENGLVDIPKEKEAEAQSELDELLELDVQTVVTTIKIPITENVQLSANDIGILTTFVEFTTEGV